MNTLRAAAGCVDLQPYVGQWQTGYAGRLQPATGAHDPICARMVLLDDGTQRMLVVVCDLIGFTAAFAAATRQALAAAVGDPTAPTFLCCTHTHSGPTCFPFRGVMGILDQEWLDAAQQRMTAVAQTLPPRLQPVTMTCGAVRVEGVGFNRQDAARGVDDDLRAVAFTTVGGTRIATLVNYATHAVILGPRNLAFSGDFPGACMRAVEQTAGGVCLYLQGACGDVDPELNRSQGWGKGTFDDVDAVGTTLASAAEACLNNAAATHHTRLAAAHAGIDVPLDAPPSRAQLDELAREFEHEREQGLQPPGNPVRVACADAMFAWLRETEHAIDAGTLPSIQRAELAVGAIGPVRILAIPFEVYSDIGRAIKRATAPLHTLIAAYSNGYYGYFPTAWAKQQGGYGADSACRWFPGMLTAVSGAAEPVLTDAAVALCRDAVPMP